MFSQIYFIFSLIPLKYWIYHTTILPTSHIFRHIVQWIYEVGDCWGDVKGGAGFEEEGAAGEDVFEGASHFVIESPLDVSEYD